MNTGIGLENLRSGYDCAGQVYHLLKENNPALQALVFARARHAFHVEGASVTGLPPLGEQLKAERERYLDARLAALGL